MNQIINQLLLKECSNKTEYFLKKHILKIRNFSNGITEKKIDFCKDMNPRLYILFLVDKYMTLITNMCFENQCYVFQVSINFDPVKEILKNRISDLYFSEDSDYSE